jgi:hypothetical protein
MKMPSRQLIILASCEFGIWYQMFYQSPSSSSTLMLTRENPFAFRRLRRLRRPGRPASPAWFYFSFALRRFPHSRTLCRLMLARSNGPVLDAQRTFKYQTATVLRGAYFQPLSRALTRPHALTRTVASLRLATAIYA